MFLSITSHFCFRLVLWSGLDAGAVVLFDSGQGVPIPFEGVISEGPAVRIQFITDKPNDQNTGFNIRYEAFEKGHCYEPYIQNGNFSTTDVTYGVGAIVQFSCEPGHSLEQGPPVIECINTRDPYWNDTEPLCKALCGGDLSGPSGLILSPNWPDWYGEGEDCSWRIHVGEEKRILLDVQLLNLSDSDMLTILDGDEVTTRILGQYVGGNSPFKLTSSTPDLTITFHSDPAGLFFGKGEGFIINYVGFSTPSNTPSPHYD
ncbi:seizure 6-like protein isoform X2 [Ictalurus furcatus]|uniref:seizure 6-like protein isoform X2 n=1 Tax=Ictalurus furcatus TaxID=66913 RepID=UPI002350243F|nr:seizure 6-like protein isoform X2 [Ictalurus furcatus]